MLRLGTRGSQLARWQTGHVLKRLLQAHPGLQAEMTVIATRGDQVLDTPLPLIGGKGLFTAELEAALRDGHIDLAVHSLKDLPTEDPDGLVIGALLERADPADALISRDGHTLETLPPGAVIGTSSNRRAAQIRHQRPDLTTRDIRGNIDTRLRKALDPDGPYDAIVLACAGLLRLDRADAIGQRLSFEQMLPAPGQGALAVQCRAEGETRALLRSLHHTETALAVTAERAFLAGLGGGCSLPVAAYAHRDGGGAYSLRGRVCAPDGSRQIEVSAVFDGGGDLPAARQAGHALARQAFDQGAAELLEALS
jgi:hydroxymethylbilane synthase